MIVWINGAFSVGKTSVATELARRWISSAIVLDPEQIGLLLRRMVPREVQSGDFQDLPAWRSMTVDACLGMKAITDRPLIVPMTVMNEKYFDETVGELRRNGADVRHFTLLARPETLMRRIRFRLSLPGDKRWAVQHLEQACAIFPSPAFAVHMPKDGLRISRVAGRIAEALPGHTR